MTNASTAANSRPELPAYLARYANDVDRWHMAAVVAQTNPAR